MESARRDATSTNVTQDIAAPTSNRPVVISSAARDPAAGGSPV
jgi:hypothetical protein